MTQLEKKANSDQSYWANVKKQFVKNRIAVYSLRFIYVLITIALLADFIANEKPIFAKYHGTVYFPAFRDYAVDLGLVQWPKEFLNVEWKDLEYDFVIFPLVPYLSKNIDYNNAQSVSPFAEQDVKSLQWRHWLGTDELGHDVLAGMIHGTRIALTVGLVSMGIASLIGIILGALAGYCGDSRLKMSKGRVWINCIAIIFACFYAFGSRSYILSDAIADSIGSFMKEFLISLLMFAAVMYVANLIAIPLKKIRYFGRRRQCKVIIL